MSLVVMDLEVETPVSNWDEARKGGCGISVMCTFNPDLGFYTFYGGETLENGALELEKADCIVTFNGKNFDVPCLEGVLGRSLALQGHYDILQEIQTALGGKKVKGTGLGPTCERTLGFGKIGNGTHAPELFQNGRFPELYSYNLHDVFLTFTLFSHIMDFGHVIGPDGDKLCIRPYEESIIG